MIPTNVLSQDLSSHDLPPDLRRTGIACRGEDAYQGLMLTGMVSAKEDEVIPPHLLRENLVVPAYPFRATCRPRRVNH